MRPLLLALGALAALAAVLAVADEVSATTTCHASGNWCQGDSHVSVSVTGFVGTRCFEVRTTNAAHTCNTDGITPGNEATWEVPAGSCITLYYYDTATGATPPPVPNLVTLDIRYGTSGTIIKSFLNGVAEPANGSSYSFCGTSTGDAGGSPRAGTVRIHLRAVKNNGAGGLGNYDVTAGGVATVGTIQGFDNGALRSQMLVSSVARNAYPAGSTFAYGPAGDETITITSTFTQPFADQNIETVRNFIFDDAVFGLYGELGATVDIDATTSLAQNFVADASMNPAGSPFVAGLNLQGQDLLTSIRWTIFAPTGHGANIVRDSDTTLHDSTTFNIDSRIRMDSDGAGGFASADETDRSYVGGTCSGTQVDLFNRGESACTAWGLVNARDEYLTRAMTFARRDASNTVCATYGSVTPTGTVYSVAGSFSTSGTCAAAADTTGSTRHLLVTNTDQSYVSGTVYRLSSLYHVDSHLQVAATLVPDDYPTDDAGEYFSYLVQGDGLGGDMSDTVRQWCKVEGVRHDADIDTSGSAVTRTIKDPTTATRATATTDTGSDGWTPTSHNLLATTPLGTTWTALCTVSFNGNTGTDTETFTVDVPAGGGGDTFQADPLKAFAAYNPSTDKVRVTISAAYLDGSARTGAASDIFVDAWNEALTQVVTAQNPTELAGTAYGVYYYDFTPATDGIFTVRARTTDPDTSEPITVGNDLLVAPSTSYAGNFTDLNATLAAYFADFDAHTEGDWWTMEFDGIPATDFVALGLWILATIWCMRKAKLFAAIAATIGIACVLVPGTEWIGWVGVLFFVLALWLEAVARDKLPYHWFKGGSRSAE